ncbi:hypothetical protein DdX_18778 [Ditylenchus destructor]|uniref:Secreted protein n=1 Tax=Ditylenchus destructor TaxID=166010 RepID=A0AAD4MKA8_9BILA|nr:hypothetical protein DdX_18778 [Ditylenchus destructor]
MSLIRPYVGIWGFLAMCVFGRVIPQSTALHKPSKNGYHLAGPIHGYLSYQVHESKNFKISRTEKGAATEPPEATGREMG